MFQKIDVNLTDLAFQIMKEKGLEPDFSPAIIKELSEIQPSLSGENLSAVLWCSIDNEESKDLDQLTYAEKRADGRYVLMVAIADVSILVRKGSAIDEHARINTTSVYTPSKVFSMLPEKLSTDLTSLNEQKERMALVVKLIMNDQAEIEESYIFQAIVYNYAKLSYHALGLWLEGKGPLPEEVKKVHGLAETLRIQLEAAKILKEHRRKAGSLTLQTWDPKIIMKSNHELAFDPTPRNSAHHLIQEMMIAANQAFAMHLKKTNIASLRRVVRVPKNWDRIVEIAKEYEYTLPAKPDALQLNAFLLERKKSDSQSFPELSLTIIKLLGRGEYVVQSEDSHSIGHFSLALSEYTHSTAPNRRFPDLITQRQYKAYLSANEPPYTIEELKQLAAHCSKQEDAAMKVERRMNKCAAAFLLSSKIGTNFKGLITGVNENGTWVRLFNPQIEGKVVHFSRNLNVGNRVIVQLIHVNIEQGFIDFSLVQ